MSEAKQGQREGERLALPLWPRAGSCPFSTGPAAALLCPHPPPPAPACLGRTRAGHTPRYLPITQHPQSAFSPFCIRHLPSGTSVRVSLCPNGSVVSTCLLQTLVDVSALGPYCESVQ